MGSVKGTHCPSGGKQMPDGHAAVASALIREIFKAELEQTLLSLASQERKLLAVKVVLTGEGPGNISVARAEELSLPWRQRLQETEEGRDLEIKMHRAGRSVWVHRCSHLPRQVAVQVLSNELPREIAEKVLDDAQKKRDQTPATGTPDRGQHPSPCCRCPGSLPSPGPGGWARGGVLRWDRAGAGSPSGSRSRCGGPRCTAHPRGWAGEHGTAGQDSVINGCLPQASCATSPPCRSAAAAAGGRRGHCVPVWLYEQLRKVVRPQGAEVQVTAAAVAGPCGGSTYVRFRVAGFGCASCRSACACWLVVGGGSACGMPVCRPCCCAAALLTVLLPSALTKCSCLAQDACSWSCRGARCLWMCIMQAHDSQRENPPPPLPPPTTNAERRRKRACTTHRRPRNAPMRSGAQVIPNNM